MMSGYTDLTRMNKSFEVYISPLRQFVDLVLVVLSSLGFIGCFIYGFFMFPWWVPFVFGILGGGISVWFKYKFINSPEIQALLGVGLSAYVILKSFNYI